MGLQRIGKVPELRRLAGRVASRSTVRWSRLRTFLGFCLLAAVVGGPTVGLPHTQVAVAAAINRLARGAADIPQTITFDQPPDTTVGRPVTITASQPGNDQYAPAGPVTRSFPVNHGIVPPGRPPKGSPGRQWYADLPDSAWSMARSRTMAGSLSWNIPAARCRVPTHRCARGWGFRGAPQRRGVARTRLHSARVPLPTDPCSP
jgi:hypothetical protein